VAIGVTGGAVRGRVARALLESRHPVPSASTTADPALRRRTQILGGLALSAAGALFAAESTRVWRLGSLPRERPPERGLSPEALRERIAIVREGYSVSSTRDNAVFNMLLSSVWTFSITRGITTLIRRRGGLGPIRNVVLGDRHIHHFVPGAMIAFLAGGTSIAVQDEQLDKWLALPFGAGVALVFDEAALLLELEDVYWTEKGVLSVQIAFAAIALLASLAYGLQRIRLVEGHTTEADWKIAASAFRDLQELRGQSGA
jgi:hypothetical protein